MASVSASLRSHLTFQLTAFSRDFGMANRQVSSACGVKPVPLKALTQDLLFRNVHTLLSSEALQSNCEKMAACLASESGLERAIQIVESHFLKNGVKLK